MESRRHPPGDRWRRKSVLRFRPVRCKRFLAIPLLACVLSCAPEGDPVRMAVLQWDPSAGTYDLRVVEVRTLDDVRSLKGEAARPIGSASIRLDKVGNAKTEEEVRKAILEDPGSDVEAQFLEEDGVLYPTDFHSLSLATAYYNFEVARTYALARGLSPAKLRGVAFYYFPKLTTNPRLGYAADNAAWFSALRAFLLFPHHELQGIPFAVNQGVIAHEYGHGLFNAEVYDGEWRPAAYDWDELSPGAILLGSIEEGFADAWAMGVAGDNSFVGRSIDDVEAKARDLTFDPFRHCYSQAAFAAEQRRSTDPSWWDGRKYEIGTMWASALRYAGKEPGTDYDRVIDALLASYRAVGSGSIADSMAKDRDGSKFGSFAAVAAAIVAGAPDDPTRVALCSILSDRFSLRNDELGGRCDGVPPAGDCR